jgi:protein involved in polysaccharide export with SLBB domain
MKILSITLTAWLLLVALKVSAQPSSENAHPAIRPEFYFVQGEVKVPQRYVFTNGLTLTAAIKRAKGFTALASPTDVSLTRVGGKPLVVDEQAIEQGKAKDIELKPGDKLQVHRRQPRTTAPGA